MSECIWAYIVFLYVIILSTRCNVPVTKKHQETHRDFFYIECYKNSSSVVFEHKPASVSRRGEPESEFFPGRERPTIPVSNDVASKVSSAT